MEVDEFEQYRNSLLEQAKSITDIKGEDYRNGSSDVHQNFKNVAQKTNMDPIKVIMTYMIKHQDAIANYVRTEGESESEPIRERIIDNINYLIFLGAYLYDNNNGEQ